MIARSEDAEPSIDEWMARFYGTSRESTRSRTVTDLCINMARNVTVISTEWRKSDFTRVLEGLAQAFCDLCIIVAKCQDQSPANRVPRKLSQDKKFSEIVWTRYPDICPFCSNRPCICPIVIQPKERVPVNTVLESRKEDIQHPQTLSEWVGMADSLYGHVAMTLTLDRLILMLIEETIGLLSIVSDASAPGRESQEVNIGDVFSHELADIFMWICLLAAKLEFSSETRFHMFVEDTLNDARKGVKRTSDFQTYVRTDFYLDVYEKAIQEYRRIIDKRNVTESEVQDFFERSLPIIIDRKIKKLISQKSFGGEKFPDFIAILPGKNYLIIEIEKPIDRIYTKKGDPSEKFCHAEQQIRDYLKWANENKEFLRKRGLPNISAESTKGLVIIGMNKNLSTKEKEQLVMHNYSSRSTHEVKTFDQILEENRQMLQNLRKQL